MNQMNNTTQMIVDEGEIDIGQLIRNIWSTRYTVIISASIFAALFASYIFFKAIIPKPLIYSQVINFAFNGAQEGKFDNGDNFHVQDILAPAVVSQVYSRHDLSRYGYSVDRFSESLSITPYAPDIDLIIKQFSPDNEDEGKRVRRIQNQAMIASEKAAREQLERELNIATSKSAEIRMVVKGGDLPVELARIVISDIPKIWAEMAIDRGSTTPSIALYTPSYLKQAIGEEENIENLQVLWAYLKDFQNQVTSLLKKFPGIKTVVDEQSGLSVLDISKLLKDAEKTLVQIPEDWSARPDFKVGLNEPLFTGRLFDQKLLQELDYQIILDILSQRIQLVRKTLSGLMKEYPYSGLVKDPVSELAITDINRFLTDLVMYELRPMRARLLQTGMSKEPEAVPLYFEFRINELQRKVDTLQASSKIIQTAEARYVQGNSPVNTAGRSDSNGAVAQFSEGFLDRVMALNTKGDDLAYRQKLNQQSIDLEKAAVKLNEEIMELRQYQQMITSQHNNSNQDLKHSPQNKDELLQRFEKFVTHALERLQKYAETTQRVSDRLFTAREIHALFSESEFAFSSPEQYLKHSSQLDTNFSDLLEKVQLYTLVVHNIFEKTHKDTVTETGNLYQLAGDPTENVEKTITRKNILLLILGSFLVGFFAMIGHLVYMSARKG